MKRSVATLFILPAVFLLIAAINQTPAMQNRAHITQQRGRERKAID